MSMLMIKKFICFLTVNHKHNKIHERLCSDTSLVNCSRCGALLICHERKPRVYEKFTPVSYRRLKAFGEKESEFRSLIIKEKMRAGGINLCPKNSQ